MAKTVKERVRAWRDKKSREGGRSLSAWLEPETARMFRSLQEHFGETTSPLVARAIRSLYEISLEPGTAGRAAEQIPTPVPKMDVPAVPPEMIESAGEKELQEICPEDVRVEPLGQDPELQEMAAKLAAGVPFRDIKGTLLVAWLEARKAEGIDYEEMAERLNRAEIPTLAGKGQWQGGMIPAFLLLKSSL